ncbi:MAG: DUF899 family protein [Candidatus Zixiibacteriota bacterium]
MNEVLVSQVNEELKETEQELFELSKKINSMRKFLKIEITRDYQFKDMNGKTVSLESLFGDKSDLILIHNMGKKCAYCTLWADGFNGMYKHFESRTGYALVSPDPVEIAREFSEGRGWKFKVLSNDGGDFTRDMGYEDKKGNPHPGFSTFHRDEDGKIWRVATAPFGPGDQFCAIWPMFEMLHDGVNGWQPKLEY